jgi:opacity protein-like surface antigen
MRSTIGFFMVFLAAAAAARAQTAAPTAPTRGYVEGVAQSAFGNVTSQSYGVEFGANVSTNLQVFVEGGQLKDVASSQLGTDAQTIAAALADRQPAAVTFSVKQPVTFGIAGIRYLIPAAAPVQPYVMAGIGAGRVKNDVNFQFGGVDAGAALAQFVTLGSGLTGEETKAMMSLGVGFVWPAYRSLILDFQYRYGRIFTDEGINTNRAGIGIGVRF